MRLLPLVFIMLAGSLVAGEPQYPLRDGSESVAKGSIFPRLRFSCNCSPLTPSIVTRRSVSCREGFVKNARNNSTLQHSVNCGDTNIIFGSDRVATGRRSNLSLLGRPRVRRRLRSAHKLAADP